MLAAARRRIEALPGGAVVLDVGGWASPLARADWVIDLMPYATRGLYGEAGDGERFSAATWVEADVCERTPWPFADEEFDFAVCSHTLEDVRDPVWVCSELSRVARAGYAESPSRLEEQAVGVAGPFVGWSHHHWLVDERDGGLEFTFKPHALHALGFAQLTAAEAASLTEPERRVSLFWEGSLPARERIFFNEEDLHAYLAEPVTALRERRGSPAPPRSPMRRWRRRS